MRIAWFGGSKRISRPPRIGLGATTVARGSCRDLLRRSIRNGQARAVSLPFSPFCMASPHASTGPFSAPSPGGEPDTPLAVIERARGAKTNTLAACGGRSWLGILPGGHR